ncbi:MAG: hypothetical protein JST92_16045 [Deltaproteobacteria bacterium]|nr:hypothetical protein [Deltaproteobacteria bacterium]
MTAGDVTLCTACDGGYFWGAFLLVSSLRRHGVRAPVHVLGKDFSAEQVALLEQFPGVRLPPLPPNERSLTTSKPAALLTAETTWAAWIDADCIVTGDVTPLLAPVDGDAQIRVRGPEELRAVYRKAYLAGEPQRGVPLHIAAQWKRDVGGVEAPRLESTCVANVIVLRRAHEEFIREWHAQIDRLLAPKLQALVDTSNAAYHMADESVLSALMMWSARAPKLSSRFRLDQLDGPHVAHFSGVPKPWQRWRLRSLRWHEDVLDVLDWCKAQGLRTPPLPKTFLRRYTQLWRLVATLDHAARTTRHQAAIVARSGLRLLGR